VKYKTLIFDFGGVILNIDFRLTHQAFAQLGIRDLDQKFSQNQQNGFFDKFEKGEISPCDFRKNIKKELGVDISDLELDDAWNLMLLDIPKERVEVILQLKKHYKCVLLSNTNQIHYDFYRANLEKEHGYKTFNELFHQTYFSHELGMRKPDSEIFKYVLNDLNNQASEVLFIDDTLKNINAAQKLGISCVLWQDKELKELLSL
jgi:putative hydrolase of the HAD superfamily